MREFAQRCAGAGQVLGFHLDVITRENDVLCTALEHRLHRLPDTFRRAMTRAFVHRHVNIHARPDLDRVTGHAFHGATRLALDITSREPCREELVAGCFVVVQLPVQHLERQLG